MDRTRDTETGVGHHVIDPPEFLEGLLDRGLEVAVDRHVAAQTQCSPAARSDLEGSASSRSLRRAVGDIGAPARKIARHRGADTRRRPGDEFDLTVDDWPSLPRRGLYCVGIRAAQMSEYRRRIVGRGPVVGTQIPNIRDPHQPPNLQPLHRLRSHAPPTQSCKWSVMTTSRRDFVQLSVLAGGAVGLGLGSTGRCSTDADGAQPAPRQLRILVLGGTGLIGPPMVEYALARGHEVTLFNRGKTNVELFPGLEKLKGDRNDDLSRARWPRSRRDGGGTRSSTTPPPSRVGSPSPPVARQRLADYYLYTSSISAYADTSTPGRRRDRGRGRRSHAEDEAKVLTPKGHRHWLQVLRPTQGPLRG